MQALSKHWLERYGEESISNWFIEGLYTHAVVKKMTNCYIHVAIVIPVSLLKWSQE